MPSIHMGGAAPDISNGFGFGFFLGLGEEDLSAPEEAQRVGGRGGAAAPSAVLPTSEYFAVPPFPPFLDADAPSGQRETARGPEPHIDTAATHDDGALSVDHVQWLMMDATDWGAPPAPLPSGGAQVENGSPATTAIGSAIAAEGPSTSPPPPSAEAAVSWATTSRSTGMPPPQPLTRNTPPATCAAAAPQHGFTGSAATAPVFPSPEKGKMAAESHSVPEAAVPHPALPSPLATAETPVPPLAAFTPGAPTPPPTPQPPADVGVLLSQAAALLQLPPDTGDTGNEKLPTDSPPGTADAVFTAQCLHLIRKAQSLRDDAIEQSAAMQLRATEIFQQLGPNADLSSILGTAYAGTPALYLMPLLETLLAELLVS